MAALADETRRVVYRPAGPTLADFHDCNAFVRGLRGPLGSAKSTTCVMEILTRSVEQGPGPDGIRRSRWAITRNTYPDLRSTTLKTWFEWCPRELGDFTQDSPITHHIRAGDVDMEVLFLALDREDDVRKLLSLELTGGWINEAREVPKAILDALTGRVGRYPAMRDGGATWSGVLMDTNPPDNDHWWYKLAEEETPEGWRFFAQPAGDGPLAENLANLPAGYYKRLAAGKDEDWIKVYVRGEYGYVIEGKPVYANYRDTVHVAPAPLEAIPALPLQLGADFGLTPTAIIGQRMANGQWRILAELVTDNCGVIRFAEMLSGFLSREFPDHPPERCLGWADPAGAARSQNDEQTSIDLLSRYTRFPWRPAGNNEFSLRKEVVVNALGRLIDGAPGFLLSPSCPVLRKGFASGYHYPTLRTAGGSGYHEKPAKNAFSHPHDALQYLLLGGGEAAVLRSVPLPTRRGRRAYSYIGGLDDEDGTQPQQQDDEEETVLWR